MRHDKVIRVYRFRRGEEGNACVLNQFQILLIAYRLAQSEIKLAGARNHS
jgi:hypothetical protein